MGRLPKWRIDPARAEESRRASRSEELVRAAGGDVLLTLPLIEPASEAKLRKPSVVAERILCLVAVTAKSSGEIDLNEMLSWARGESFWQHLSENEARFLADEDPEEGTRLHMSWQVEAALPLLWALGAPLEVGMNLKEQAPRVVLDRIPQVGGPTTEFVKSATLRPVSEILDECDLIYRVHWAARNAQMGGKPTPADWEYGVIMERHKALNWLICYGEDDGEGNWDAVGTDT
jgi:hypothetical protein